VLPPEDHDPYHGAGDDPRLAEALMTPREAASAIAVAKELRVAILAGEYNDAGTVPSRVELGRRHNVSPETASEGLLRIEQGRRTAVLPVRRHEVTVLVPRVAGSAEGHAGRAERRVRVQEDDDPAIGSAAVTIEEGLLRVSLTVTAADSGRAAARAIGLASYACPASDGWDLAEASVSARPA
jgi:hypothetical protein